MHVEPREGARSLREHAHRTPGPGRPVASAEPGTVGAAKAIRGRELGDKVLLVGFDFSDTIEQDLKDGVTDALVVQDPFQIGFTAVKSVVDALDGQTPQKRIETPIHVLTADDLSRPEIDELLHPTWTST